MYNITDNYNSINHDIQIIEVILYCSDRNKAIEVSIVSSALVKFILFARLVTHKLPNKAFI